jgi:hypothetical protein
MAICDNLTIKNFRVSELDSYTNIDNDDFILVIESGSLLYSRKTTFASLSNYFLNSGLTGSYTGSFTGSASELSGVFSGSLFGTSSYSNNSTSSSYSITSSYSGYSDNNLSSSYSLTSSYSITSSFASNTLNVESASHALNADDAISSSYALSASYAVTSTYAESSSDGVPSNGLSGLPGFLSVSSPSTIENYFTSWFTVLHTFGQVPSIVQVTLKCISSDVGFIVNDEVDATGLYHEKNENDVYPVTVYRNVTEIGVNIADNYEQTRFYLSNKTNGNYTQIDLTKWKFVIRTWK